MPAITLPIAAQAAAGAPLSKKTEGREAVDGFLALLDTGIAPGGFDGASAEPAPVASPRRKEDGSKIVAAPAAPEAQRAEAPRPRREDRADDTQAADRKAPEKHDAQPAETKKSASSKPAPAKEAGKEKAQDAGAPKDDPSQENSAGLKPAEEKNAQAPAPASQDAAQGPAIEIADPALALFAAGSAQAVAVAPVETVASPQQPADIATAPQAAAIAASAANLQQELPDADLPQESLPESFAPQGETAALPLAAQKTGGLLPVQADETALSGEQLEAFADKARALADKAPEAPQAPTASQQPAKTSAPAAIEAAQAFASVVNSVRQAETQAPQPAPAVVPAAQTQQAAQPQATQPAAQAAAVVPVAGSATTGGENRSGGESNFQGGAQAQPGAAAQGLDAARSTQSTGGGIFVKLVKDAQPAQVAEQVAVQVKTALRDGSSHIRIQLNPEELGRLDIKLHVLPDGKTGMVITADNKDTLEMLQRDARNLGQALADAGLKADTGSLSFNLRGGQQQQQQHAFNGTMKTIPEEDPAQLAAITRSYTVNLQEGLDIRI